MNNFKDNNLIFKKIWNNLVIRNEIFKHCRLFKIYKFKCFNNLDQLKRFQYLEYITTIAYNGSEIFTLKDLPIFGNLKILIFTNEKLCKILSLSIPFGIEEIVYPSQNSTVCEILSSSSATKQLLPSTVKIITNLYLNKDDIDPTNNIIPQSITSISFSAQFNETLKPDFIPSTVKVLKFLESDTDESFWNNGGESLKFADIPFGVEELDLGFYHCGLSKDVLPNSITNLTMDHPNNFILEPGFIPNSVLNLMIYSNEHDGITITDYSIPNSVTHLTLNSLYTKLSMNSFPTSLVRLELGEYFCCNLIRGMLPKSLEYISFSTDSTFTIENGALCIEGLKTINCLTRFEHDIEFDEYLQGWSPDQLNDQYFPQTLLYLNLGCNFKSSIKENDLPNSLETLIFGYKYDKKIDVPLPKSLTCLDFSKSRFNHPIDPNILPSNLKTLKLNRFYYKHSTDHLLILNKNLNIFII